VGVDSSWNEAKSRTPAVSRWWSEREIFKLCRMGKGRPNRREKMMEEVAINSKWLPQVQSTWRKNCHCDAFYFRARRFCTVIPYVLQNLAKAEALTFDSVAKYHYKWRATGSLSKDKCFADLDWGDLRLRDLTVQNRFAFSR